MCAWKPLGRNIFFLQNKGTQGGADDTRSLKQEAQDKIEELGPKMLSFQQFGTLRATSVKRGASKAA